jgi:hypothetical protein
MSSELFRIPGIEDPAHLGFERRKAADHRGIALEALQIGAVIRVIMEDRGAAIAASEDMVEPAWEIESWLAGHWGERSGWSYDRSMRMRDPNSMAHPR